MWNTVVVLNLPGDFAPVKLARLGHGQKGFSAQERVFDRAQLHHDESGRVAQLLTDFFAPAVPVSSGPGPSLLKGSWVPPRIG